MDLFDIYQPNNLENPAITGGNKDLHLMLRTYELLDFIKKFLRPIEFAITNIGAKFIQKYCIEKMRGENVTT